MVLIDIASQPGSGLPLAKEKSHFARFRIAELSTALRNGETNDEFCIRCINIDD